MKKTLLIGMIVVVIVFGVSNSNMLASENTQLAQWFFLVAGPSGGFSTTVFVVVGPFREEATCKELAGWAKSSGSLVSKCWAGNK